MNNSSVISDLLNRFITCRNYIRIVPVLSAEIISETVLTMKILYKTLLNFSETIEQNSLILNKSIMSIVKWH